MAIAMIVIDLGNNSCSLSGLDESGGAVLRRRMQPAATVSFYLAGEKIVGARGGPIGDPVRGSPIDMPTRAANLNILEALRTRIDSGCLKKKCAAVWTSCPKRQLTIFYKSLLNHVAVAKTKGVTDRCDVGVTPRTVVIVQQAEQLRACHETLPKVEGFRSPS
jgi:hypothetical protein